DNVPPETPSGSHSATRLPVASPKMWRTESDDLQCCIEVWDADYMLTVHEGDADGLGFAASHEGTEHAGELCGRLGIGCAPFLPRCFVEPHWASAPSIHRGLQPIGQLFDGALFDIAAEGQCPWRYLPRDSFSAALDGLQHLSQVPA